MVGPFQERRQRLRKVLHTDEIDHHGACPVGRIGFEQRLDGVNVACVVNQTVQTVARSQNRVGCVLNVRRNAQVAGHSKGGTSVLLHVRERLCEFFTLTCEQDNRRSSLCKFHGNRPSDALRSTRDHVDLTVELRHAITSVGVEPLS